MAEFVARLYITLAEIIADFFVPNRFKEAAQTGPAGRRIVMGLFVGFGSLIAAGLLLSLVLAIAAVAIGIFKALTQ